MSYSDLTPEHLSERIRAHCQSHGISPTRFGIEIANDPNLVGDLGLGRNLGLRLYNKIVKALGAPPNTPLNALSQTGD